VSITSFIVAYFLLKKFAKEGLLSEDDPNVPQHSHDKEEQSFSAGLISKYFNNRLVFFIAILSILSYVVFAFIDFTFLSDIKLKFVHGEKIATFIAIFFATGRLFAIAIKVFFSSRMISNIGLSNSLLVTPIVLLAGSGVIIFYQESPHTHLYLFGAMVLLSEILRSTLQEPVFFILFQPLKPHDRLRGHLVAKGHTMPVALIAVGSFLVYYLEKNAQISIPLVVQLLVALLLAWIGAIFLIKKEYVQTLVTSVKERILRRVRVISK
jgi:ATP/ADP translocase